MAHVRQFDTGATRDDLASKPDYEGYLSPQVLERYGRYMLEHQTCADGSLRASDNWQLGIPKDEYIKSAFRHFMVWWWAHRNPGALKDTIIEEALCALLFNTMGYLHEMLKTPRPHPWSSAWWCYQHQCDPTLCGCPRDS